MEKQLALAWTIGCVGLLGCTEHHVHYHGYDGGEDDATVGRDAEIKGDATVREDGRISHDASLFSVEASISAVSLADDCGSSADAPNRLGACAPLPENCQGDECDSYCGFCQQSNMQLSLKVTGVDGPVDFEIVKVELLDAEDMHSGPLDALSTYEPKFWDGDAYSAWNEQLSPGVETKASYNLTAPDWEKIGNGEPWTTYSRTFVMTVTIKVADQSLILHSDDIMREPEIVT